MKSMIGQPIGRPGWAAPAWILCSLLLTGCVSTQSTTRRAPPLERADLAQVEERIRRNAGDMESMQMEVDGLRQDLQRVQANSATSFRAQVEALQVNLNTLAQRMNDMEAQRIRDQEELIKKLSARITDIIGQQPSAPPSRSTSEYGWEHVVTAGDTLSSIAAKFGVSMRSIIEANRLTNPDVLPVGKTLFIPDSN